MTAAAPEVGQVAEVRARRWVVTGAGATIALLKTRRVWDARELYIPEADVR